MIMKSANKHNHSSRMQKTMSKRKENSVSRQSTGRRKLIKARHDESAALAEFEMFALRENGEEKAVIGGGSFEGVNLESATAMLTQLAHSLACELQWERFTDLTMEEFSRRQHLVEGYRSKKAGVPE
jgi:hypothetical protein